MNIRRMLGPTEVKHAAFQSPLAGAERMTAEIHAAISTIRVSALPSESDSLIEAELDYLGELTATAEGGAERRIVIRDEVHQAHDHSPKLVFDIRLHPTVPLSLSVGTASGEIHLDLAALEVRGLEAHAASGSVWASLPASEPAYAVRTGAASGDVTLELAAGVRLSALDVKNASGNVRVEAGVGALLTSAAIGTASGDITLNLCGAASTAMQLSAVSGDVSVYLTEGAPARVDVQHILSGSVKMRADLRRVSGSGRAGVWQTASYRPDAPAIALTVASLVSGDVHVR